MGKKVRALETRYQGYRFRSRLEARWAVWFDAMGLEWQYEEEGFDLGGVRYLPDFHLTGPDIDLYVEVKPPCEISQAESDKIAAFLHHKGPELLILMGPPGAKGPGGAHGVLARHHEQDGACALHFQDVQVGECPCCGGLYTIKPFDTLAPEAQQKLMMGLTRTPKVQAAHDAARAIRFGT